MQYINLGIHPNQVMENLTDKEKDEKYNENYEVKLKSEFFQTS